MDYNPSKFHSQTFKFMHELRRQTYLSLLGIDSYIPRWELHCAKVSQLCATDLETTHAPLQNAEELSVSIPIEDFTSPTIDPNQGLKSVDSIFNELAGAKELAVVKEIVAQEKVVAKPIVSSVPGKQGAQASVKPFTLSVWRLESGLMIVDSRDTQQALPTDLFLQNLVSSFYPNTKLMPAEIIRWPLVENRFASMTEQDAREEIQTWLSVQMDISPLKCLWVMGDAASKYLLPEGESYQQLLYSDKKSNDNNLILLVSESLNELLKNPLQKKKLLKFSNTLTSIA